MQSTNYDVMSILYGKSVSENKNHIKPTFKIEIEDFNTVCANVYNGTLNSVTAIRHLLAMMMDSSIGEFTVYVNKLTRALVVKNRTNIPQLINPESHIEEDDPENGLFIVRRYIVLRTKQAFELAKDYISKIDPDACTVEDHDLKRTSRNFTENNRVLCIEYCHTEQSLLSVEGVYDPVLDLAIHVHSTVKNIDIEHPKHDLNSETCRRYYRSKIPRHSTGLYVAYCSSKNTSSLYMKIAAGAVEIKPQVGNPVVITPRKENDKVITTDEYIAITNINGDGTVSVSYYTLEYACKHFNIYDSKRQAEQAGVYALSESAAWKEEQAKHERNLQILQAQHKADLDKAAQKLQLEHIESLNKQRLQAERDLNEQRLKAEQEKSELRRTLAELEIKMKELDKIRTQQEHKNKTEIEEIKLNQQRSSASSDASSGSMKNTGEGIKLAATIIGAAVTVGAVLWKVFS